MSSGLAGFFVGTPVLERRNASDHLGKKGLNLREIIHAHSHPNASAFTETKWSVVALAAANDGTDAARHALERLCVLYWQPIYWFLRRQGKNRADAEDLTQGFFAELLSSMAFGRADREKGRFRNFLLGSLQRYQADVHRREIAEKRGKSRVVLAFDFEASEREYSEAVDPNLTPEESFDRRWAAAVLDSSIAELRDEFHRAGKSNQFIEFSPYLSGNGTHADYVAMAQRLDVSVKSIPSAVCRFRDRYRELVHRCVLATVVGPEEVDQEFRELFH